MTEPKAPSFNGVEIRKGDAGTLNVIFGEPDPSDGTIRIYVDDGAVTFDAWVGVGSIASHTPAPRPLVPGPATFMLNPVTVKAVVDGRAWISSQGEEVILDAEDTAKLRNIEGAAS